MAAQTVTWSVVIMVAILLIHVTGPLQIIGGSISLF